MDSNNIVSIPPDLLGAIDAVDLSDTTKDNYRIYATTLAKHFNTDLYSVIIQTDTSISWIMKHYGSSDPSKKNMMAAVVSILKHYGPTTCELKLAHDKWRTAYKKIHDQVKNRYKTNQPSDKQIKGYVPFSEIEAKRDSLVKGSPERLLLAMYTIIRPLRGDFNKLRMYTGWLPEKPEANYIHLLEEDSVLVLNEYKTANQNGEYRLVLPATLITEIKAALAKRPRDYLFVKTNGEPFELANSYVRYANNILKRLFGRALTLSLVRHSFISSLDFNTLSISQKEEIAKDMTQSVQMQDMYRFIFTK